MRIKAPFPWDAPRQRPLGAVNGLSVPGWASGIRPVPEAPEAVNP